MHRPPFYAVPHRRRFLAGCRSQLCEPRSPVCMVTNLHSQHKPVKFQHVTRSSMTLSITSLTQDSSDCHICHDVASLTSQCKAPVPLRFSVCLNAQLLQSDTQMCWTGPMCTREKKVMLQVGYVWRFVASGAVKWGCPKSH